MGNRSLQLFTSERFNKSYRKANLGLQNLAEGAVHDFIRRFQSNPKTILHNYDRLAHISTTVLEIDLSGGARLLAHYNNDSLILLEMGDHEIVTHYDIQELLRDIQNFNKAPKQFWPGQGASFFIRLPDRSAPFNYPEEISAEWLFFLEEEQEEILYDIAGDALQVIEQDNSSSTHFIIGGPGTGKTCIILNLLKLFTDLDLKVGIVISENLAAYTEVSTGADLAQFRISLSNITSLDLDILLLDDPNNLIDTIRLTQSSTIKVAVLAFDPLQVEEDITDDAFEGIKRTYGITTHILGGCYRQKENVGKATKHVIDMIATSTPFLRKDKIKSFRGNRQQLTELANNLNFINPHGYIEYYPNATVNDILHEVRRILAHEWLMWKHWPGLLILLDGVSLTEASLEALGSVDI